MNQDKIILRELANLYAQYAFDDSNAEKVRLHRAVNDLRMIRPVVTIDELPWSEMNIDGELTLRCKDPEFRDAEWFFKTSIFKCKHFRADLALTEFFPVPKIIRSTGHGVTIEEDTLGEQVAGGVVSHAYKDQIKDWGDLEKLKEPVITYDEPETLRLYNKIGGVIGDILPVKLTGMWADYGVWDHIAMLHGVENMFIDLYDRPDFMHKTAETLISIYEAEIRQYEELNLFEPNLTYIHCTPAAASDLTVADYSNVKAKDTWGRASAQIFCGVSPEMHDEFETRYAARLMKPFGLNYYGCCEPLHNKIHTVEKIPNLRKIGVSPWADKVISAEMIGKKYVYSAKPNPAFVALKEFCREDAEIELRAILDACSANGCNMDITLKDISTVSGNPINIIEWKNQL